jgi:hypothetical protein
MVGMSCVGVGLNAAGSERNTLNISLGNSANTFFSYVLRQSEKSVTRELWKNDRCLQRDVVDLDGTVDEVAHRAMEDFVATARDFVGDPRVSSPDRLKLTMTFARAGVETAVVFGGSYGDLEMFIAKTNAIKTLFKRVSRDVPGGYSLWSDGGTTDNFLKDSGGGRSSEPN